MFNVSDHIDLASFTLFPQGMIMITDSMVCLKPSLTKFCFEHTQNVFQDIPELPNWSKNFVNKNLRAKKNNLMQSQFSKKRGGVRQGMIMITDLMGFLAIPKGLYFGWFHVKSPRKTWLIFFGFFYFKSQKLVRNNLCLNPLLNWTLCSNAYWLLQ